MACCLNTEHRFILTCVIRSFQLGCPLLNSAIFLQTHHGNAELIPLNAKHPNYQAPERVVVAGALSQTKPAIFNPFSRYSSANSTSCKTLQEPTFIFQVGSTASSRNICRHITDYMSASSLNFLPQSFSSSCRCPLAKYLFWGAHTDVFCVGRDNACET
jgi:hypothetical protein